MATSFARFGALEGDDEDDTHEKACEYASGDENVCPMLLLSSSEE